MKQIQRILQESTHNIFFVSVVWFFFQNETQTFYCFKEGIEMDLRYVLEEGEKRHRDGTSSSSAKGLCLVHKQVSICDNK